jgi:hypothetical protein
MAAKKRISRVDGLAAEVLAGTGRARRQRMSASSAMPDEVRRLTRHQYGRALRNCLSRAEVHEIVSQARRKAWPQLNEVAVRLGSPREFAERASSLGADFRIANMSWPSGLALFGFYIGRGPGASKRPLICINGAHHRAAIGTAFSHEVGHHVTADLFGPHPEPSLMSLYIGYDAHLGDPRELAADIMVSLGIYPRAAAIRQFGETAATEAATEKDRQLEASLLVSSVTSTSRRYGLDLDNISEQKKIQYQAGLIHFTKLRRALLDEYDI